jgi:hypothetical protein
VSQSAGETSWDPVDLTKGVAFFINDEAVVETKGKVVVNYEFPPVSASDTIVHDANLVCGSSTSTSTDSSIYRSYVCYKHKSPPAFKEYVFRNANNPRDRISLSISGYIFDSELHDDIKDLPAWEQFHELKPVFTPFDAALVYLHEAEGFTLPCTPSGKDPATTAFQLQQLGYKSDNLSGGESLRQHYKDLKLRLEIALDALKIHEPPIPRLTLPAQLKKITIHVPEPFDVSYTVIGEPFDRSSIIPKKPPRADNKKACITALMDFFHDTHGRDILRTMTFIRMRIFDPRVLPANEFPNLSL